MIASHPPLLASAVLALAIPLAAQTTKVLPPQLANTEAGSSSAFPFGYTTTRTQQIWIGQEITSGIAILDGFRYRRDYGRGQYGPENARTYNNATISIGTTEASPGSMSTTFQSNITSPLTAVLNGKTLNLPALPKSTNNPEPFNIGLSWSSSYLFDPLQGNLILDLQLPNTLGKSNYFVDSDSRVASGDGRVLSFGTGGSFSQAQSYKFTADATQLLPGSALSLSCGPFTQSYPGTLVLGISNSTYAGSSLPIDLSPIGAQSNSLYVSLDFPIPFSTSGAGTSHTSKFRALIPKGAPYRLAQFYAQAYYLDPAANAAGLVTTNALNLRTANSPSLAVSNAIGTFDTAQLTGNFVMGRSLGGPVVQFQGTF